METPSGLIVCTVSVGLASAPMARDGGSELESLLLGADAALYVAKANGRNRVELAERAQAVAVR